MCVPHPLGGGAWNRELVNYPSIHPSIHSTHIFCASEWGLSSGMLVNV